MVMPDNKDIPSGLVKVNSIVGAMKSCTNYKYMLIKKLDYPNYC